MLHTSQARNKVQFQKSICHPSIRKIDEMRKCSCHPSEFETHKAQHFKMGGNIILSDRSI
jgi:hypothetical protein